MNAFSGTSEPDIQEAYLKAEPKVLSPASPKPIHFPQPTNIPVLDNMMDVGFNQTEFHMDTNSRDTELRPGAWRDHNEPADQPSPFSTGGDAPEGRTKEVDVAQNAVLPQTDDTANSTQALSNGHDASAAQISNGLSFAANSFPQNNEAPNASISVQEADPASSDPSVPSAAEPADATQAPPLETSTAQSTPFPVNVQALLDTLQTSIKPAANVPPAHDGLTAATTQSPPQPQARPPTPGANAASPPSAGLPPRPPPQDQPLMNPNYAHSQIRHYHPHAANPATQLQTEANSNGSAPAATYGNGQAYTTQQSPTSSSLAAPSPSTNQAQEHSQPHAATSTPIESRREFKIAAGETPALEDAPWSADVQRKYDHFMDEERRYVNEAKWDQFPNGSRLFVGMPRSQQDKTSSATNGGSGNLSSEKVTKRDIFHVFHPYGELAQISIKQAYGFVQFLRTEDCMRALEAEQGRQIRDKRIHLEISKPQKPSRSQQQQNQGRGDRFRSRSPDNRRGHGNARYDGGRSGRRERRDGGRESRDYRPYRSPSPRDNRYEGRYRTRSRSPGYDRIDRYRGESLRRYSDDDLGLPRRAPKDVPEVQIIVLDNLHRDFVVWVEREFSNRSVRVDVLTVSPRLSEEAVVRRQIVEGVIAVCKLRRGNQDSSKIGLTIFKRQGGTRDVQFEEYDHLDPGICAELVVRVRSSLGMPTAPLSYGAHPGQQYSAPAPPQQYGYQQPPAPYSAAPAGYPSQGYGQAPPAGHYGGQPSASLPPSGYPPQPQAPRVDSNNLQTLLSTLNTASPATAAPPQPYRMPPQPGYPPTQQYQPQPYTAYPPNSQPPQQPPAGQTPQNMQDILARLSTYRQ